MLVVSRRRALAVVPSPVKTLRDHSRLVYCTGLGKPAGFVAGTGPGPGPGLKSLTRSKPGPGTGNPRVLVTSGHTCHGERSTPSTTSRDQGQVLVLHKGEFIISCAVIHTCTNLAYRYNNEVATATDGGQTRRPVSFPLVQVPARLVLVRSHSSRSLSLPLVSPVPPVSSRLSRLSRLGLSRLVSVSWVSSRRLVSRPFALVPFVLVPVPRPFSLVPFVPIPVPRLVCRLVPVSSPRGYGYGLTPG